MYTSFVPVYFPAPPEFFNSKLREQQEIKFVSQRLGLGLLIMQGISLVLTVALVVIIMISQFSGSVFSADLLNDSIAVLTLNVIMTVPMFLISFILCAKMLRVPVGNLVPLSKVPVKLCAALVVVSLACGMIGNIFSEYVANLLGQFKLESPSMDFSSSDTSILSTVIMTLTIAAVPALIEEFAFRGIFLGVLRRFGDLFAIVMSSLFFGLIHGNLAQAPFAFIIGLGLGYSVTVTGSLWPAIITHFLNNLISVISDAVAGHLGYNSANLIFAVYMVGIILIGLLAAAWLFRKKGLSLQTEKQTVLYTSEKVKAFFSAPAMIISLIILISNIFSAMFLNKIMDMLLEIIYK